MLGPGDRARVAGGDRPVEGGTRRSSFYGNARRILEIARDQFKPRTHSRDRRRRKPRARLKSCGDHDPCGSPLRGLLAPASMGFPASPELAAWLASLPFGQALRRLNWLVPCTQIIPYPGQRNGPLGGSHDRHARLGHFPLARPDRSDPAVIRPGCWVGLILLTRHRVPADPLCAAALADRRHLSGEDGGHGARHRGDARMCSWYCGRAVRRRTPLWRRILLRRRTPLRRPDSSPDDHRPSGPARAHRRCSAALTGWLLWIGVTLAGQGRWITLLMMR